MLLSEDYVHPNILDSHVIPRPASCDRGKVFHFISTICTLLFMWVTALLKKLVVAARYHGDKAG